MYSPSASDRHSCRWVQVEKEHGESEGQYTVDTLVCVFVWVGWLHKLNAITIQKNCSSLSSVSKTEFCSRKDWHVLKEIVDSVDGLLGGCSPGARLRKVPDTSDCTYEQDLSLWSRFASLHSCFPALF